MIALALFRRPVGALIDRARRIKTPGGIEISTTTKQDDALSPAKIDAVAPSSAAPFPQLIIKFDSVLVRRICESLESHLTTTFKNNASDRERFLIKTAADAVATGAYEHMYIQIYGSQLAAVRDLNSAGVVPASSLEPYFLQAKEAFPTLYENDTFDRWLAWLTNVGYFVQRHNDDRISISDIGRDFLQYVVSRGYQFSKAG
jgi:hypothetical protein